MRIGLPRRLYVEMAPARPRTIICDVDAITPDVHTIDALARLQLAARRLGMEVVLFGDDPWAALAELDAILRRRGTLAAG